MSTTVLVSTRKGLFTVVCRDSEWDIERVSFVGDNVTLTFPDHRDGAWYAALDHGHFGVKLHRSDNRGETWSEVGVPTYPEVPEGQQEVGPSGRPLTSSLKLFWALESAGDDRPGELWAGTIPGGLFRSRDRGDSWELVKSLWEHPLRKQWFGGGADDPGIHSVLVDPADSRHVFVGVSCGGVWETTDDGETWEPRCKGMRADFMPPERAEDPAIQDPHIVVACPADFSAMWTQHHCGIWRSRDGAKSWQQIKAPPSSFGFAVAVHPRDPNTAYFVPAISDQRRVPVDGRVVVTRTRDGGENFDVLTNGLPQRHAYDLVFRHALAIDPTGERLAFGSTTGNLWISDNAGDSFACISHHLPQIYAVRFVPGT